MNPLIIIVVFVALLAGLLYYLQGRQQKDNQDILPRASAEKTERTIVKASEYQAQYEKEKETEKEPEKPTQEPKPEEADPTTETPDSITEPESSEDEDISMLDGVGPKYQKLLRAAGYNTIKSIADSTPEELYEKMLEANTEHEITKRPPTMSNVEDWVSSAKNR